MDELPPLTGSAKSELISRLKAASEPSVAASASKPTPNAQDENRALFMSAMSDPVRRQIAFNVVERNCRDQFAEGAAGAAPPRVINAAMRKLDEYRRGLECCLANARRTRRGGSRLKSPSLPELHGGVEAIREPSRAVQ